MITIIVPWHITKSFSLPYGGIPGFSGACWKARPLLPRLLWWGTLTARESLEIRNGSNVELKKCNTEACLTRTWCTCEKQNPQKRVYSWSANTTRTICLLQTANRFVRKRSINLPHRSVPRSEGTLNNSIKRAIKDWGENKLLQGQVMKPSERSLWSKYLPHIKGSEFSL